MAETYYNYTCTSTGVDIPSGTYTYAEWSVTVGGIITFLSTAGTSRVCILNLTGDVSEFNGKSWTNGSQILIGGFPSTLVIYYIEDGEGTGITGVSGLIAAESVHVDGLYSGSGQGSAVTPVKTNYIFSPTSFTFDSESGAGVYVTFLATGPVIPTLEHPTEDGTNYYLNKDWLLEMRWADTEGVPIADHTLYFAASGDPEFIPRVDRTRYSIVAYKMWLDITLDYSTTYYWFIRKDLGGGAYIDSDIWAFTTMAYSPPEYSTRTRTPYGGGDAITVPTGENNMITVQRLIAVARNKFFYEDV